MKTIVAPDQFLPQIMANPHDRTLIGMYADFLEENGDRLAKGWRTLYEGEYFPGMRSMRFCRRKLLSQSWFWTSKSRDYLMQDKHAVPQEIFRRMTGKPVFWAFSVRQQVKFKMTLPNAILMFVEAASA